MAVTAETRGGCAFRALPLLLAVVSVCGLTTARSVPESGGLVPRPRYGRGAARELQGVYQLDACAWIQGGFNPSVGVCELNPQYGKLLLETTSHPLKEELFEEGDCFISGLEACDSRPYCTWIPRTGTNPARCVYQKAPDVASLCTSEGLESFSGNMAECKIRSVDTCSKKPECTVVGEENELKRCGMKASTTVGLLTKSDINQGALLKALIEGARALHWMDVPAIVPEGFDAKGEVLGRRRLLQDITSTGFNFGIPGSTIGGPDGDGSDGSTPFGSVFASGSDSVSFSVVSSDGGILSGDGVDYFGIQPQEDGGNSLPNSQVPFQSPFATSDATDTSVPRHVPTTSHTTDPVAHASLAEAPGAVPAGTETEIDLDNSNAGGLVAAFKAVNKSESPAVSSRTTQPQADVQTVPEGPSSTKVTSSTRPATQAVPKGVMSVTAHTRPSPRAQKPVPKGLVSTTAHTGPNTGASATTYSGNGAGGSTEATAGSTLPSPSEALPLKSDKQEMVTTKEDDELDEPVIGSPERPVRKGQMSITAMTKMTGQYNTTAAPEAPPVNKGMEAPPGSQQGDSQQVPIAKVALPSVNGNNDTGSSQMVNTPLTDSGPGKKKKTEEDVTTMVPVASDLMDGEISTPAGATPPLAAAPSPEGVVVQATTMPNSGQAADDTPVAIAALDSGIVVEPSANAPGSGESENDIPAAMMDLDGSMVNQPSTETGPFNSTEGGRAKTPDRKDSSFHAASDDPKRLSADEDPSSNPVSVSIGGGRTQNTVVAVVPFSDDRISISPSPSPGLLTSGFGTFIASSNITGGIGSGFTGKSSDETGLGPTTTDSPRSEEATSLMAVLASLEGFAELLQVKSSATAESDTVRKLVDKLAENLEKLRYGLDATYTKSTFSLWSEVDAWWWKLQISFEALAKESQFEDTALTTAGCTLKAVADDVGSEMESRGMTNELQQLENASAKFGEFADDCPKESDPLSVGEEEFGDLITIVVKAVNVSVTEVYPIRLDGTFATEHNQSWVAVVAQRNQIWNDIRQNVSAVSLVGTFVKAAVRGMLLTLPFVEERLPEQFTPRGVVSGTTASKEGSSPVEMEPQLDELLMLMDDFAGVMVAIFEGNYTLASVNTTKNAPGLEDWQLGPVSADTITDAVERAVNKTRFHPALLGNAQQLILDGVVGIVLDAIEIMKAKVFPRAKQRIDLAPPPQGSMILNLLSSIETLMEGWMGFASERSGSGSRSTFGSNAAREATLHSAVCLALGGNSEETCSAIDLPFTGQQCVMREPPPARHTPGTEKLPEKLCMPQKHHQLLKIDEHLQSVPEEYRGSLSVGMSDLLDAAADCAAREAFHCEANDMCTTKNVTRGLRTQMVCGLASDFVNTLIEGKNVVGFVGKNKSCMKYLSRPKCTLISSFAECSAAEKCIWRPDSLGIMGQAPSNASITPTGGQRQPNRAGSDSNRIEKSTHQSNTPLTTEDATNRIDGPGYCVDDWVMQLEDIVEDAPERVLAMMDKHTECRDQLSSQRCGDVDAEQKVVELFDATIPTGGSSMSKYIALSVSVGGTLVFVAILAIIWKVVKGRSKQVEGKLKKGDRKASSKCGQRVRSHCLPWFPRLSAGKGGKGKGDAQKKKMGEGKIPATGIRDWGQPSMIPPPAFVSTTIMISDPEVAPSVQKKAKNLSDFGFVLGSIEGSTDSQQSGVDVPSAGGRYRPGHITSEIEAASMAERSDNADTCSESAWSASASSAWSDEEVDEHETLPDWSSLPANQNMQMK